MLTALVAMLFQSTLPRRERHEYQRGKLRDYEISIHAPAKGATGGEKGIFGVIIAISIHAPVKGATPAGNAAPP